MKVMEYEAFDGSYFLLGVNPQILLECPKDKNELEMCASAFLERIVQIDSFEEYLDEFQIIQSQLETIASHMCEELTEGFFLDHFIAGLGDEYKSFVKRLAPSSVYWAGVYVKHAKARENQFTEDRQELKGISNCSSSMVADGSQGALEVDKSKFVDEICMDIFLTSLDRERNDQIAQKKQTVMVLTKCLIECPEEVMVELFDSGNDHSYLKLISPCAQLINASSRDFDCNYIPEMELELKEFKKDIMDDRNGIIAEMEGAKPLFFLRLEYAIFDPGLLCEFLWDPGRFKPSEITTAKVVRLRMIDEVSDYLGKGVSKAMENVNSIIGPALIGKELRKNLMEMKGDTPMICLQLEYMIFVLGLLYEFLWDSGRFKQPEVAAEKVVWLQTTGVMKSPKWRLILGVLSIPSLVYLELLVLQRLCSRDDVAGEMDLWVERLEVRNEASIEESLANLSKRRSIVCTQNVFDGEYLISFFLVIKGLKEKLAEAMSRDDVKAVVLTGKNKRFSGGFDINVFQKVHKTGDISVLPSVSVDLVVNTIEDAKKPIVAAVEGLALGGGLEIAMGCHARIAAPKTQLGLPELSLGVMPGFGGTQRLPRLLGLSKAVEMMLTSKPIMSEEGQKLGLIDAVVPSEELLNVSKQWALDISERRKPWVRSLHSVDKLGSLPEALEILNIARQQAKRTAQNLPQHQACLDVIEEGVVRGGYPGVLKEEKVFNELVVSPTSKGLVHVFFAQRATSKVPNVTDLGLKPRSIKKVAVIGGGLMGSGIATALLLSDIFVVLKEVNSEYLLRGIKSVEANVRGLVTRKKLSQDKAEKTLSRLKGVLDYSEFRDADMVIEAVIENVPLKQKIFSEIENACPPHCILATNTSTIDLNLIGQNIKSQDRVIGAHFFSPAHVMPLLEIVRTEKTSAQVILDLMTVGKAIKKVPVVVGNCTGFAVNRTFFPYSQSAHLLVHLGVDVFRIDRLISSFGLPMGPFQLQDLAGYGVAVAVGKEFGTAFSDRTFQTPLIDLLIKNGRNGKNNGKGYYIYEKGTKPKPDPSVLPIIEESRRLANVMPKGKPISITDQEVLEMVLFPVVNEACRVLDEGVVVRASDLDIASVLGMSFPSYRGGIVFWADTVGPNHIYTSLKKWSEKYGDFFKPSRYLEERARNGVPLSTPSLTSASSRPRL